MHDQAHLVYIIKRLLYRLEKRINRQKGTTTGEEEVIIEMARSAIEEIDREAIHSGDKTWRELH